MKFNPMTGKFEEDQKFGPQDLIVSQPEAVQEVEAVKEILNKVNPVRSDFDSSQLEDVGYEPPTQEQINAPGFQAAAKYLKNFQPIVGTKAAELLNAYKEQEASRSPASVEGNTTEQQDPASLLNKYKELISQRDARNFALDIGSAANRLGSAIAGKGATGGEFLQGLKKQSEQHIQDLLGQGKVVDLETEVQMSDFNSDISRFARERAIANATKMGVPAQTISKLEKMSAKQLEKLGLFKSSLDQGSKLGLYYTTIRDKNGQDRVVGIDRQTGEIVQDIGGKAYSDKIIENKQTGQSEIYRQGAGISPLNKTTSTSPEEIAKKQGETKVEYSSPTSLNRVNPNLYKKFNELQSEFNKDMKDSREVATSVTNLANKLEAGKNIKIDSGLLGGIQTQAAKMAGQKGVLTDQDLVKFAGAGGVSAAIDRFFSGNFDGEMSDQDVKFFKAFAKKMEQSLQEDIQNRSKLYTGQVLNEAKDYLPGLQESDVQKWMNVEQVAPAVQKPSNKQVSTDKTLVKKQYSPSRNKTRFIYSDGTEEIKDGQL